MRLVLAGTPEVALPSLRALLASRHEVVGVVTRPDAPAGRGRAVVPSPVRRLAEESGLEVLTPTTPSDAGFLHRLSEIAPDACPVVAYGALLRPDALAIPPHGWINLHFSLLPAWRGAAPVQHALIAGDDVTGASTFRIEEGLDTGPILGTMTEPIHPDDTAGTLLGRLAEAGAHLLVATMDGIEDGSVAAYPQPTEGVSPAPKITPADAHIDWRRPDFAIDRRIRGCTPAPGAWTVFRGARIGLGPLRMPPAPGPVGPSPLGPGEIAAGKRSVIVGTATGAVELGTVQAPGKRPMSAADWARGARPEPGEAFEGV